MNADGTVGPDGASPYAEVTIDASRSLLGTTAYGGPYQNQPAFSTPSGPDQGGIIWEITRKGIYKDLHDFGGLTTNTNGTSGPDGQIPLAGITIDDYGNLYGAAATGGAWPGGGGLIWKLSPGGRYADLHDFGFTIAYSDGTTGPDGLSPIGNVTLDRSGNLFAVAQIGGKNDAGLVCELRSRPQSRR